MKKNRLKLGANLVFLCLIIGILFFLVRQSFASIVTELLHTTLFLVLALLLFGTGYQLI